MNPTPMVFLSSPGIQARIDKIRQYLSENQPLIIDRAQLIKDHEQWFVPYSDNSFHQLVTDPDNDWFTTILAYHPEATTMKRHAHDLWEQLVVLEGQIHENVSDKVLNAGDVIVFPVLEEHELEISAGTRYLVTFVPTMHWDVLHESGTSKTRQADALRKFKEKARRHAESEGSG